MCFADLLSFKDDPIPLSFGCLFLNEKGEKPQFHETFKLVFFSMNLLPLYFLFIYWYHTGFALNLHQSANISFLFAGLVATVLFIETFLGSAERVWDERVSGLRFHLTEKKNEKIAKLAEKQNRGYCRFFYKIRWFEIGALFAFIIWGSLAFNVLRQGLPPEGYDEFLYKREAPVWENNAYFVLAGLDAPKEVTDYYEYGLQEVVYNSERFARHKKKTGIPYTHDVPDIEITLYEPCAIWCLIPFSIH